MSVQKKITGLGKGLGALLPSVEFTDKGFKFVSEEKEEYFGAVPLIDISKIKTNRYQPRKQFDEEALESLKESVLQNGVIQPVLVRRDLDGYELIAGERRLRATKLAGLTKIPAIIKDIDSDIASLELAIIENVQREDLNPIETANGYRFLIEEYSLTQEQVALKVGKDRTTVTNFLRLLKLPEKIQNSIIDKKISMGHARALLTISEKTDLMFAWNEIIKKDLSVRATEHLTRNIESGKLNSDTDENKKTTVIGRKVSKPYLTAEETLIVEETENNLRHIFATQVKIQPKSSENGTIEIEYYSKDDFIRLIDLLSTRKKR